MKGYDWNRGKESGITIIEIITVFAIIAVLSVVVVPGVISWVPDYRLRAAISGLFSNMQRAKQEAVRTNGECAVYFDAAELASGTYYYQIKIDDQIIETKKMMLLK